MRWVPADDDQERVFTATTSMVVLSSDSETPIASERSI